MPQKKWYDDIKKVARLKLFAKSPRKEVWAKVEGDLHLGEDG